MSQQTIRVPQLAFFGDSDLELELPESWDVIVRPMPGHDLPPLTDDEIRAALADPIGAPRLRDLARGKREAVIIFDDMSRPTPVDRLWPFVVEELHAAGLEDRNVRMIVGLGLHAAHTREDFRRKLGDEALRRFPVYNHNPYEHCTYVGTTSRGTPVELNAEVLACDLRIAIGSVLPHPFAGFGGGPKIILPGVVSFKTIYTHHGPLLQRLRAEGHGATLAQGHDANLAWQDIAEAAALAGLQFKLDAVLNARRQVVGLFAGHFVQAWERGVRMAKEVYATAPVAGADVVIANAYGKGNEAMIAARVPNVGVDGDKDEVVIVNCPQGQVVHYLLGDFGSRALGSLARPRAMPPGVRRMIVFNPYPEKSSEQFYPAPEQGAYFVSTWEEVLDLLTRWHPNGARVAVYPDLTTQYLTATPV